MHLEIITPDEKVYEGDAASVVFPGLDGLFEVLNNHAPMVAALSRGKILIKTGAGEKAVAIESGIVEVLHNRVSVLAEGAAN